MYTSWAAKDEGRICAHLETKLPLFWPLLFRAPGKGHIAPVHAGTFQNFVNFLQQTGLHVYSLGTDRCRNKARIEGVSLRTCSSHIVVAGDSLKLKCFFQVRQKKEPSSPWLCIWQVELEWSDEAGAKAGPTVQGQRQAIGSFQLSFGIASKTATVHQSLYLAGSNASSTKTCKINDANKLPLFRGLRPPSRPVTFRDLPFLFVTSGSNVCFDARRSFKS